MPRARQAQDESKYKGIEKDDPVPNKAEGEMPLSIEERYRRRKLPRTEVDCSGITSTAGGTRRREMWLVKVPVRSFLVTHAPHALRVLACLHRECRVSMSC